MTEPMTATEVLFDEHELARRARTTLAGAERGVLVVANGRATRYRELPVEVADDGGEALVAVPAGGPLDEAVGRRAHAALILEPNEQYGVGLTLIGRLLPAAGPDDDDGPARSYGSLTVERVLASCPVPERRDSVPRREIPLHSYAAAEPDAIAAHASRIARHLTEDHQDQVRRLAARCAGVPVERMAAAQLSRLAADGTQLWWVDDDGAHRIDAAFDPPARDLAELGLKLRALLASGS